ncbi:hypothetical protein LG322_10530 [Microbacterium aerolatum]|nr:hypothetical protein [Microbacterium aerolatum]MCK3770361.1 hypothetical protein [Microbacterium aerolatum]
MTSSKTQDAVQAEATQEAQLSAPAVLNLLGDESAGGCCGGGSCAMPGA